MESLKSETKGFVGGGAILATGLGVSAFILAVFCLTYLNAANRDDFTDNRKQQVGRTAWAYFGFLFAIIIFFNLRWSHSRDPLVGCEKNGNIYRWSLYEVNS